MALPRSLPYIAPPYCSIGSGCHEVTAMEWNIAIIISVVGISLALARSTWIIDYAVFIFVFNRGLRRLVDYYINESFNPLSPISLTPLIVSGAMAVPLVLGFKKLPSLAKRVFLCFAGAIGYAFAVGFVNQGLGAGLPVPVTFELTMGLRYYFTENIGVYVETGITRSLLQGGITARF